MVEWIYQNVIFCNRTLVTYTDIYKRKSELFTWDFLFASHGLCGQQTNNYLNCDMSSFSRVALVFLNKVGAEKHVCPLEDT